MGANPPYSSVFQLSSGCVFVVAAQSIFSNRLLQSVPEYAPGVDPLMVLGAGATKFQKDFSPDVVRGILQSFMVGLRGAFALGLAAAAFAVVLAFTPPMKKIPTDADQKKTSLS